MGSCMSGEKRLESKQELTNQTQIHTKVEQATIKKISQMNPDEKLQFTSSEELIEFLKLYGKDKASTFKDILQGTLPNDNPTTIKFIQSAFAKIQIQKDKSPPTSNPNHSQFSLIMSHFSNSLEKPLSDLLKTKTSSLSKNELQDVFLVSTKTLLALQSLQDPNLKQEEHWWESDSSTQLIQEISQCKSLLEPSDKSANYLSDIYGSLNTGDVVSVTLRNYFPSLYKEAVDEVISKRN